MSQKLPPDRESPSGGEEEQDLAVSLAKAYTALGVRVYYDRGRCLRFAECLRGLPEVFDVAQGGRNGGRRSWLKAGLRAEVR